MRPNATLLPLLALLLAACGDDDRPAKACTVGDAATCAPGFVCEPVAGQDEPGCFAPVYVHGRVFDLDMGSGVAAARVDAEEAGGRPVGDVATTADDGTYVLRIPSVRKDGSGAPAGQTIKLGAAARDYAPFPGGLRVSLPIDTAKAERAVDGAWVIEGGATSIGLDLLPEAMRGLPSISGTVEQPRSVNPYGTIVTAENFSTHTITGRADARGEYVLFNVPAGTWTVHAYRRGLNHHGVQATVEGADVDRVDLKLANTKTATLSGAVSIVAGSGATSVVVALANDFDDVRVRGTLVPGLRAPEPGAAPDVTGAFRIDGIPDGYYVVLAAFENDGLVRDPDPDIAGTQIQRVLVLDGVVTTSPAFKVTSAVKITGPGAGDSVETISGTPTFRWEAYPSAKSYLLELFDTYGKEVWTTTVSTTSAAYGGSETLEPGMPYQWRVTAFGNASNPISITEDLRGVFQLAAD